MPNNSWFEWLARSPENMNLSEQTYFNDPEAHYKLRDHVANKANQERMRQWASPVKKQNKQMKNQVIGQTNPFYGEFEPDLHSTSAARMDNRINQMELNPNRAVYDIGYGQQAKLTGFEAGSLKPRVRSLAGPIGKLPLVGALPLPSVIAGALEDDANKDMAAKEKMMRFLLRSGGVDPNYNPDML